MNKYISKIIILMLVFYSIILLKPVNAEVSVKTNKNVLFISSYNPEFISFHDQVKGIKESLGSDVTLQIEYMDFKKYETDENRDNFYRLIKYKLSKTKKIDAVIVGDDPALLFALNYREELFKDVPIIFLGINNLPLAEESVNLNSIYGVGESPSIEENIDLIYELHKPKSIVLLTDNSILFSDEIKMFNSLKDKNNDVELKTISLNEMSYVELFSELNNLNENDVLLTLYAFSDNTGESIPLESIASNISNNTTAIIYTALEYLFEPNFVGGKVISHYEQGKKAGELANSVLNDDIPEVKYITPDEVNKNIYNYDVLKKYGIKVSSLPDDSVIIGQPIPLLIKYKEIIIPISIVLGALVTIILVLIFNTVRRTQHEIALLKAKEAAEEANSTKSHFVSNISHELRTPVTVALSSIDLITLNLSKTEDLNTSSNGRNLNIIKQNCFRQLRLINNLIDIAKSEAGYMQLHLKNVEIVSEIEDIVLSVVPYGEKKHIDIIFDTSDEEIFMAIDTEKLERILLNLLSNAIKFSKEYGNIFVNVLKEDNKILLSVEDFGKGISSSDYDKIFDKFTQLDETMTRENEGSGIGLSIVKYFIKLHGGNITVKSEVGKGSKFTVELPIKLLDEEVKNANIIENGESTIANTNIELSDIYF